MINPEALNTYFKFVFGRAQGWLCVAFINPKSNVFSETFFQYPAQLDEMIDYVAVQSETKNAYFCPQLFKSGGQGSRRKDNVSVVTCAWADLDTCHPELIEVQPSVAVESSPNRYQALWMFSDPVEPQEAEDISKRIAYLHKKDGADLSGWDLTQLLRIPMTKNFKYPNQPMVQVLYAEGLEYEPKNFSVFPKVFSLNMADSDTPMPDVSDIDVDELLELNRMELNPIIYTYYSTTPDPGKWSHVLRSLEMFLFEAGFTREQVFAICLQAACNKYRRDNRPDVHLWQDVLRAYSRHVDNEATQVDQPDKLVVLLSEQERERVRNLEDTFVERYIKWAGGQSDAAKQYHQAGAFIILSALLCGSVTMPTSYGEIIPNMWFMILGDTTLTRKSTSMDMAMDLLGEVDSDSVLATDGTLEGLMTSLAVRPKRPSVFLRDEFSGLLEAMIKRDYMAGMPEMLTKLYDGKMMKRVLRKETFEVHDPRLIIFAGGIKNKVTQILNLEHVSSGFIPRFVFITAESDITRVRPLGPPMDFDSTEREKLIKEMEGIRNHYQAMIPMAIGGSETTLPVRVSFKAKLSREAWVRVNELEMKLIQYGIESEMGEVMTPVGDRLSKSILKAAILIACSRQFPEDGIVHVDDTDILRAIKYGESWRTYADEIISNIGINSDERVITEIEKFVRKQGSAGVSRSAILRTFRLTARQGRELLETMVERNMIDKKAVGKAIAYYVV